MSNRHDQKATSPTTGRQTTARGLWTPVAPVVGALGTTAVGIAALSAFMTRAGLAMTLGGDSARPATDAGPTLLPDPSVTAVPNPPFPEGLTDEERRHLVTFDELDFEVFSKADWARLGESHAQNIRVHWPDGHYVDGIDQHIDDMDAIFAFAPDAHIHSHPLRIARGDLTCVIGVMAGTFTRPMADGKGGHIAPTNRPWAFNMATVGVWNRNGTMDEEWLYYDNQTFYSQLGTG